MPAYTFDVERKGLISDGYHTFDELYRHRSVLFAAVCKAHSGKAWKSLKHHDNTMYEDYFIVGVETPAGQFTYHYPMSDWGMFEVREVDYAPEWDGHTSDDVTRLLLLDNVPMFSEIKVTINLDPKALEEEYQKHRKTLTRLYEEVLQELDRFLEKNENGLCEHAEYNRIIKHVNELKQFNFGETIEETVCDMAEAITYKCIPIENVGTAIRVVNALDGITAYTHLEDDN